MDQTVNKFFLLILILSTSCSSLQAQDSGDWQFELSPLYVWGAGISASTAAEGGEARLDTDYEFFSLSNIEMAGSLNFNGNNGRIGFSIDAAYVDFGDRFLVGPLTTDVGADGGIFEATFDYNVGDNLKIFTGVRQASIDADIEVTPGISASAGKDWVDPIIGAQYLNPLGDKTYLILRGDVGGFGYSSDFTSKLEITFGYDFSELIAAEFGYRYYTVDFQKDLFVFDASLQGIVAGLVIKF
ncbi:MAG: hypothetical protein GKR91_17385 [Pseudomonadales bacterium]|nr:hypothetical protein [Pseudomonadales bacterium]